MRNALIFTAMLLLASCTNARGDRCKLAALDAAEALQTYEQAVSHANDEAVARLPTEAKKAAMNRHPVLADVIIASVRRPAEAWRLVPKQMHAAEAHLGSASVLSPDAFGILMLGDRGTAPFNELFGEKSALVPLHATAQAKAAEAVRVCSAAGL